MEHNKLVRDKIPEIIKESGSFPVTHIAEDKEYWQALKNKLKEETEEFLQTEKKEELVDILEVIHAICNEKNIDKDTLESLRKKKVKERGSFKNKIILDKTKPQNI